ARGVVWSDVGWVSLVAGRGRAVLYRVAPRSLRLDRSQSSAPQPYASRSITAVAHCSDQPRRQHGGTVYDDLYPLGRTRRRIMFGHLRAFAALDGGDQAM